MCDYYYCGYCEDVKPDGEYLICDVCYNPPSSDKIEDLNKNNIYMCHYHTKEEDHTISYKDFSFILCKECLEEYKEKDQDILKNLDDQCYYKCLNEEKRKKKEQEKIYQDSISARFTEEANIRKEERTKNDMIRNELIKKDDERWILFLKALREKIKSEM